MANRRTSIVKIKEAIRQFKTCNLSKSQIARALNISRPVVIQYIADFEATGLKYEEIKNMPDDKFMELFEKKKGLTKCQKYQQLSKKFNYFTTELKRTGVTLYLLWKEYIEEYPMGYSYSQFCYHYQVWRETIELSMHMEHKAGDRLFVDYTGQTFQITDRITGKENPAEVFIAVLGASELTYAEATSDQKKENWIYANVRAMEFYDGVPLAIVPDCTKTAVTKADKYDPDINPEYQDFADHYGTAILAARARHPKDKALAENGVRLVYQRIFAPLRNRKFYSLEELNTAIREKLDEHNNTPMTKLKVSRRDIFNSIEKGVLKHLPSERYEIRNTAYPTIQINYHVYLPEDKHYYSVPFYLRKKNKKAKILYTQTSVKIFHNGIRVASYKRDRTAHGYTTKKEHMPPHHRFVADWNPQRITNWALKISNNTAKVVQYILNKPMYPELAYKICIGIISQAKKYGSERLDKACAMTIEHSNYSLKSIKSILSKGLDKLQEEQLTFDTLPVHENIRGKGYYSEITALQKKQQKTTSVETS